jgi:hypothetical protein
VCFNLAAYRRERIEAKDRLRRQMQKKQNPAPGSRPKLRLKDVTLCAADCIHPALAARALEASMDKVAFADAVLYCDVEVAGRFRTETIAPIRSGEDYSRFCLRELAKRIATPFALVVQWDGYVIDPAAWTSEFLRYDYIGAPGFSSEAMRHRPWVVGNGGFSLRSRRLLDAVATLPRVEGIAEDRFICEVYRNVLEGEYAIRFAPEALADRFAFFQRDPRGPTFGFHGFYNLHRAGDDDSVIDVIGRMTREQLVKADVFTLLHMMLRDGRNDLARRAYAIVRGERTADDMRALLTRLSGKAEVSAAFVDRLEALSGREAAPGAS